MMVERNKVFLKIILGFLFIYFILRLFIPFDKAHYGWIEISDKYIEGDTYYILANFSGENIEIESKEDEPFIFEDRYNEIYEVKINEVWNILEINEKYFISIYTDIFKSTYRIEKLYEN